MGGVDRVEAVATQVRVADLAAVRAVGAANGRNPISIIAPCHRVIGASGDLTGFAGGLEAKRYLLDLEAGSLAGSLTRHTRARSGSDSLSFA